MTNAQKMALVQEIFRMIFASKQTLTNDAWTHTPVPPAFAGFITGWQPRGFVKGTVRGADVDVNIGNRILQLRFMEQNMNKTDNNGQLKQTAIRARNGECIMWVVDRTKQFNAFLGSIQNGNWMPSQDRAARPVSAVDGVIQAVSADGTMQTLPAGVQTYEQARSYMDTAGGASHDRSFGVPDNEEYVVIPEDEDIDPSAYDYDYDDIPWEGSYDENMPD